MPSANSPPKQHKRCRKSRRVLASFPLNLVRAATSWARGKSSAANSQETDLESQNETHLNELHSKLKALRGVSRALFGVDVGAAGGGVEGKS